MSNKSFKKFLTTASAIAMITTGAYEAAANSVANGTSVFTATPANWVGGVAPASGATLQPFGANGVIDINTLNAAFAVDVHGYANVTIGLGITANNTLTNIFNPNLAANSGVTLEAIGTNPVQITMSGAFFNTLGVDYIDFNNKMVPFIFTPTGNGSVNHTNVDYLSTGGNAGEVRIASGANNILGIFNNVANAQVSALTIAPGAVATTSVHIYLGKVQGGNPVLGDVYLGGTLNVVGGDDIHANVQNMAGGGGVSTLNTLGATTIYGNVGSINALSQMNVSGTTTLDSTTYNIVQTTLGNQGVLAFNSTAAGGLITYTGLIDGAGTLETLSGHGTQINSNIGSVTPLTLINIQDNTTVTGSIISAQNTEIATATAFTVNITNNSVTYTGNINGAAANDGVLDITNTGNNNHTATFVGNVGGVGFTLSDINLSSGSAKFTKGDIAANAGIGIGSNQVMTVDTTGAVAAMNVTGVIVGYNFIGQAGTMANTGALLLNATDQNILIHSNIGSNNGSLNKLAIDVNANKGVTFSGTVEVGSSGIAIISGANSVTTFNAAVITDNIGDVDLSAAAGGTAFTDLTVDGILTTGAGTIHSTGTLDVTNTAAPLGVSPATAALIGSGGAQLHNVSIAKGDLDLSNDTTGTSVTGDITMGNGNIKLSSTHALQADGNVTFTAGGNINLNGGTFTIIGAGRVEANTGYQANIIGAGTINLGVGGNNYTGTIQGNIGTAQQPVTLIAVQNINGGIAIIGGANTTTTNIFASATTITPAAVLQINSSGNSITYYGTIDATVINGGGLGLTNAGTNGNQITIAGKVGNTYSLVGITVDGTTLFQDTVNVQHIVLNSGKTTFNNVVTATNDITINNSGANAVFLANVNGAIIATATGSATFGNGTNKNITVAGDGGVVSGLGSGIFLDHVILNLGGGTLSLTTGKVSIDKLTFNSDDTFTIGVAVNGTVEIDTISTLAGDNTGTINMNVANGRFVTNGNIGGPGARLKALNFANNTTININNGNNIYSAMNGTNMIVNVGGVSTLTTVGSANSRLAQFNLVNNNDAATLDALYAINTTMNGAGSSISLNNNGTLQVGTLTTGGDFYLVDNATIYNIGAAGALAHSITINKNTGGIVKLAGNILAATTITQNGNTLQLTQDSVITGTTYTVAGASTIDTNGKALQMNTLLHINNPLTLKATVTGNTILDTAGQIPVIGAGGSLTLVLNPASIVGGQVYNLFGNGNAVVASALAANQVSITNAGRFYTATYIDNALHGTIGQIVIAANAGATGSNGLLGNNSNPTPVEKDVATVLMNGINNGTLTGDGLKLSQALNAMDDTEVATAMHDITDKSSEINTASIAASASHATSSTLSNISNLTAQRTVMVGDAGAGVGAGDASERFGIWAQVMGTKATQKERKQLSGYDLNGAGLLVGFDTMVNDNATLGMVASAIKNDVKFKNSNTGDKTNANSFIFGVYGKYDIAATDFFVQGNLNVAQTAVNSKGKKLVAAGGVYETAKAKYDILGVGAELVGGYRYSFDTTYIAPTIGLRYNYFGDTSYTGTGLTVANQSIKTKATSMVSGLLGTRIGATVDMDGTNIMPEAHINLSYAFNAPSTKTSFKIGGIDHSFTYSGPKAARFAVNGGFGVMAEADGFEYGIGYDANISDKYLGHTGTLKVRVKL